MRRAKPGTRGGFPPRRQRSRLVGRVTRCGIGGPKELGPPALARRKSSSAIDLLVTRGGGFYNPFNTALEAVVSFTRHLGPQPPTRTVGLFRERVHENRSPFRQFPGALNEEDCCFCVCVGDGGSQPRLRAHAASPGPGFHLHQRSRRIQRLHHGDLPERSQAEGCGSGEAFC